MPHFSSLKEANLEESYLTIGSFDGIHIGHQAIIDDLVSGAREAGVPSVVLTFFPHPAVVLRGRTPAFYIMTPDEKAAALSARGVEIVITETFSSDLAAIEAGQFLTMLEANLGMQRLYAGENFTFGHDRAGDTEYLQGQSQLRGFEFILVPPVYLNGELVSSTRVRQALRDGDVLQVSRYLDRYFSIPGVVTRGVGRGRQLGYPTANLTIWDQRAFPAPGVYACWGELGNERIASVVNIGIRPTFDEVVDGPVIEAHLLDFDQDIYGDELVLHFVKRLREERKFPDPGSLQIQIEQDVRDAKAIFVGADQERSGGFEEA